MREVPLTDATVNGPREGVGVAGGGSGGIGRGHCLDFQVLEGGRSEGRGRLRYGHLCKIFRTQGGGERAHGGNRVESLWRGGGEGPSGESAVNGCGQRRHIKQKTAQRYLRGGDTVSAGGAEEAIKRSRQTPEK